MILKVLVAVNFDGQIIRSLLFRDQFWVFKVEVEREVGAVELNKIPVELLFLKVFAIFADDFQLKRWYCLSFDGYIN